MKNISLFVIILLAFAVRFPGVFWGVNISAQPHFLLYNGDESHIVKMSDEFISHKTNIWESYPKGFSFQIALSSRLVGFVRPINDSVLILIGRALSVFYAMLTVLLVYFLVKELFSDSKMALASSAFLALAELQVSNSHYATVDTSLVFWFYATIFFALLALRRNKDIYFFLGIFSLGMALAVKLSWVLLAPVLYVLVKQKKKWGFFLLTILGIFLVVVVANGGRYTFDNFKATIHDVMNDNINVIVQHNKFYNPIVYLFELVPGMGIPSFVLLLFGGVKLIQGGYFNNIFRRDSFFLIIIPVALQFLSVCFLGYTPSRHLLPAIPLLAIISAYGLVKLRVFRIFSENKIKYIFLLSAVFCYQFLYVAANEYNYIFDTRAAAGQWINENVPYGTTVGTTPAVVIPLLEKKYKPVLYDFDAPYFVLNEHYYYRYRRSFINPFEEYPGPDEIMHDKDYGRINKFQALLKGKSHYKLIQKFTATAVTPEMYLYKRFLGSYLFFNGDTLIYQRTDL